MDKKVEEFFAQHKKQTFKKGEILIRADDDPTGIFYLTAGIVRQYYISRDGQEITLNMFKPCSFFPMSWAISDIHNGYFFEAMQTCIAYKAPKNEVLQFIKNKPGVLFDLLRRIYIGIEGLWMHIEYLSTGNAYKKLIAILVILGKRFGKEDKNGITIQIKMTEKELGEYAGMYRETVSREIKILKEKGLVYYSNGKIIIPKMHDLENILAS